MLNKSAHQSGFTLIEMIIAIGISAIVAAMAYQSLEGASNSSERTRDVINEINRIDKAWQLIGQDMRNQLPTLANQVIFKAASLTTKGKNSFQIIMQFGRRGWVNPMGRMRSDLQQVNYRIAEGKLIRDYLPERNRPLADIDFEKEALHQVLLEGVTDIQLRFLSDEFFKANGKGTLEGADYSNTWPPTWPPQNAMGNTGTVIAVEITIEVEGVGRSVRLFEIPK
ncbi:MAG TPA: type II secretion system minor pseudopilin GspJ [Cellvibrio sp.]|nr:type II secretion system minor pseudopilin GspJ [Cellvibrio sp.]